MDPKLVLYPQKQRYFKLCRIIMMGTGIWPARNMDGGAQRWQDMIFCILLLYFVCSISAMLHYISQHFNEGFIKISELLTSVFIAAFTIPHHIVPFIHKKKYGELFKEFYEKLHLSNYCSHDEYSMKILLTKERMAARMVKYFMVGGAAMGPSIFTLVPVFINMHNGAYTNSSVKLESTLSLTMPFDAEHDVRGWAALTVVSLPVIYGTPLIGISTALIFLFFVSHFDGHLEILAYNLSKLPSPDVVTSAKVMRGGKKFDVHVASYSPEVEEIVKRSLASIVQHHNAILRFRNLIQSVYGELLLSIYLFNMVGYCLVLLQLTRGGLIQKLRSNYEHIIILTVHHIAPTKIIDFLKKTKNALKPSIFCKSPFYCPISGTINTLSGGTLRFGVIAAFLFAQMSFFSLALEDLYLKMNGLSSVFYQIPWYAMERTNRRTVLFAMMLSHNTKRFSAAGLVNVSAPVMLSIVKTTASYFAFLRTFGN